MFHSIPLFAKSRAGAVRGSGTYLRLRKKFCTSLDPPLAHHEGNHGAKGPSASDGRRLKDSATPAAGGRESAQANAEPTVLAARVAVNPATDKNSITSAASEEVSSMSSR